MLARNDGRISKKGKKRGQTKGRIFEGQRMELEFRKCDANRSGVSIGSSTFRMLAKLNIGERLRMSEDDALCCIYFFFSVNTRNRFTQCDTESRQTIAQLFSKAIVKGYRVRRLNLLRTVSFALFHPPVLSLLLRFSSYFPHGFYFIYSICDCPLVCPYTTKLSASFEPVK